MRGVLVLRASLGITFLWIGILIFNHPAEWANFLSDWFVRILPFSPTILLKFTSVLDMGLGIAFLLNFKTRWVGLIGVVHMVLVLISSGITDVTIRDIAILGACYFAFTNK